MIRNSLFFLVFILTTCTAFARQTGKDSTRMRAVELADDELGDLDELMDDLALFLDSLLMPRSYVLVNVSVSNGYFNYKGSAPRRVATKAQTIFSPLVGYYHKSGLGITATGFMVDGGRNTGLYQFSLSPSYDYLENRNFATGVAYTRYFSKDSLAFYVSPLQNEVSAYFTYRKSWIRPSVMVTYAWGNEEELETRLGFIESLRLRRRLLNLLQERYDRSVNDFSATASLRHDFYWLDIFSKDDNIRLTPQVQFTAGTQQFGFNQGAFNYNFSKLTRANLLTSARQFNLDRRKEFKALSVGLSLKTEYAIGRFYVQPQVLFDYYLPAADDRLATMFSVNAGISF